MPFNLSDKTTSSGSSLSDAIWFMIQHKRWGLIKANPGYLAVAKKVNRADIYKQAAAGVSKP